MTATRTRGRPIGTTAKDSLSEARRRKEWALARTRECELERRRGQLLDAGDVERQWTGTMRQVRAGVLAVTSRIRARLPHLTAHDAAVIDEELRQALTALADDADD